MILTLRTEALLRPFAAGVAVVQASLARFRQMRRRSSTEDLPMRGLLSALVRESRHRLDELRRLRRELRPDRELAALPGRFDGFVASHLPSLELSLGGETLGRERAVLVARCLKGESSAVWAELRQGCAEEPARALFRKFALEDRSTMEFLEHLALRMQRPSGSRPES